MKDLGLYVHIPFCEQKCHYCAFASRAGATAEMIDDYTAAVVKEIRGWGEKIRLKNRSFTVADAPVPLSGEKNRLCQWREFENRRVTNELSPHQSVSLCSTDSFPQCGKPVKDSGDGSCCLTNPVLSVRTSKIYQDKRTVPLSYLRVRTVYFGGGTPSFISEENIRRIMMTLGEVFGFDPQDPTLEKTIEVNPGSATSKKLTSYHQMGFNRLSIGLQTAQNHLLKSIGRIHRVEDFSRTIQDAVAAGFENISADLLFGLPQQKIEDVRESIDFLLSFPNIRHISCYSLSIEPGTKFDQLFQSGQLILPDEETERDMYDMIRRRLTAHGVRQYEISNFAFPGFESRHNSAYWNLTPYLGFGAAAASFCYGARWTNFSDAGDYRRAAAENRSAKQESHLLSEPEQRGDFMFLGLRRMEGVRDRDYHRMFGGSFFEDYNEEIRQLLRQGLIDRKEDRIFLTRRGLDLANQVFMAFV